PELTAFLGEQGLEPRKFPEFMLVLDSFPFTPAGKVDKRALAGQAGIATGRLAEAQGAA
ncbi:MAG: long-chain fatty acid--CoA ligase, partial [Aldersonia sp.]|nr:long-chain fatty acid--CoA ligase [Aldersonia sp.]